MLTSRAYLSLQTLAGLVPLLALGAVLILRGSSAPRRLLFASLGLFLSACAVGAVVAFAGGRIHPPLGDIGLGFFMLPMMWVVFCGLLSLGLGAACVRSHPVVLWWLLPAATVLIFFAPAILGLLFI